MVERFLLIFLHLWSFYAKIYGNHTLVHSSLPVLRPGEICKPGQVYREDCNTCKCSNSHELLCTLMACIDHELFEKLHHSRKSLAKSELRQLNTPVKLKGRKKACVPGTIYNKSCNKCYCTAERHLICTMIACKQKKSFRTEEISSLDVIPILNDTEFVNLQSLAHHSSKCQPGHMYRVLCNTCLCMVNGNLMCTLMLCKNFLVHGMASALRQSGSPCKDDQKYDLECLKCECRNGTSHCEAKPNCAPNIHMTRKYSRDCKSKIQCDLALDPEVEVCEAGESYIQDCNKCHCQIDLTLRCTQKMCLNFVESQQLNRQLLMLWKNSA